MSISTRVTWRFFRASWLRIRCTDFSPRTFRRVKHDTIPVPPEPPTDPNHELPSSRAMKAAKPIEV